MTARLRALERCRDLLRELADAGFLPEEYEGKARKAIRATEAKA